MHHKRASGRAWAATVAAVACLALLVGLALFARHSPSAPQRRLFTRQRTAATRSAQPGSTSDGGLTSHTVATQSLAIAAAWQQRLAAKQQQVSTTGKAKPLRSCRKRAEWTARHCTWAAGTNRVLRVENISSTEGTGNAVLLVGRVLDLAIRFNMHVAIGDVRVGHGVGPIGSWLGLRDSPLLVPPHDPALDAPSMMHHVVELTASEVAKPWEWFSRVTRDDGNASLAIDVWADNQVFHFDPHQHLPKGWGYSRPVGKLLKGSRTACKYPRQILKQVFWSVPHRRDRCQSELRRHKQQSYDWTIAVHIRRGDAVTLGKAYRLLPMGYYAGMVKEVLAIIAKLQRGSRVAVILMSEAVNGTMVDVFGRPVAWTRLPSCSKLGLQCTLMQGWQSMSVLQTLDCMATVDVLIGSISSFSHLARALSSNVHILPRYWMAPTATESGKQQYDNGDIAQDSMGYVQPWRHGRWRGARKARGVPGVAFGNGAVGAPPPPWMLDRSANSSSVDTDELFPNEGLGEWQALPKVRTRLRVLLRRWQQCRGLASQHGSDYYHRCDSDVQQLEDSPRLHAGGRTNTPKAGGGDPLTVKRA